MREERYRQQGCVRGDPYVTLNTPLSELLEGNAVREALSADADPFQNSITPQLVQHQVRGQLPSLTEQE